MRFQLLLFAILLSSLAFCQESSRINALKKSKETLEKEIRVLTDSLKIINKSISDEEAREIVSKADASGLLATFKEGAKLKIHPNAMEEPIYTFKRAKEVRVVDYSEGYFGVVVDTIAGYINEVWAKSDERLKIFVKAKEEEERKKLAMVNEKSKEVRKEKIIAEYGAQVYYRLEKGEYWIGMSDELAIISLGYPAKKNRTVGSWGVHEQWIYEKGNRLYLYFENGILTSYQN
ncbi:MAG: hypothetical protein U0Y08_05790 [Bacteroidia bacterium]